MACVRSWTVKCGTFSAIFFCFLTLFIVQKEIGFSHFFVIRDDTDDTAWLEGPRSPIVIAPTAVSHSGFTTQPNGLTFDSTTGEDEMASKLKYVTSADTDVGQRFTNRRHRLSEACLNEVSPAKGSSNRKMTIASGRLHWCLIPKVGTTFVKSLQKKFVHNNDLLGETKPTQAIEQKRFFFVREPYSRLVSGYLGKIMTNPGWWVTFGSYIIKNFRPQASGFRKSCGDDVTFPEFIKYFIHSQRTGLHKNIHFFPIHEMCNMCTEKYDFIGHLENFPEDFSYILRAVNISAEMNLSNENSTILTKCRDTVQQIKKLHLEKCSDMCSVLEKVWWSFQARGYISTDHQMPLAGNDCHVTGDQFGQIALAAHSKSSAIINKSEQKKNALAHLFLQVPLEDRLMVQDLLHKDFLMFGYDPQPPNIFPELVHSSDS